MTNFKPIVEAYALVDPKETDQWVKEFNNQIISSNQSRALTILKDCIK